MKKAFKRDKMTAKMKKKLAKKFTELKALAKYQEYLYSLQAMGINIERTIKMKRISKLKKFWHTSDGEFKVPYFWATLFLSLFFIGTGIHIGLCIYQKRDLTPILGILAGLVMGLIYLYNQGKDGQTSSMANIRVGDIPEKETITDSIPGYEDPPPPPTDKLAKIPQCVNCSNKNNYECTLSTDMYWDCINSGYKKHRKYIFNPERMEKPKHKHGSEQERNSMDRFKQNAEIIENMNDDEIKSKVNTIIFNNDICRKCNYRNKEFGDCDLSEEHISECIDSGFKDYYEDKE